MVAQFPLESQIVVGGPYSSPLGSRCCQWPGTWIHWPVTGSLTMRSGTHMSRGLAEGEGGAWGTGRVTDCWI
jgi:hypothetical protein